MLRARSSTRFCACPKNWPPSCASQGQRRVFRKEAQAYLRASHALGCLAFDQERYQDALVDLERVYAVDQDAVGTEARLIAGAALLKLKRPADAVPILEVASKSESGPDAPHELGLATLARAIGPPPSPPC